MPRCVSNDAKHRMVNVSSTIVIAVSAVRSGRRRIVEMPMLIAAITVLKREISAWCTVVGHALHGLQFRLELLHDDEDHQRRQHHHREAEEDDDRRLRHGERRMRQVQNR
jgi:hypothetical protein